MKKLFALLVVLSLCIGLIGCTNAEETITVTCIGDGIVLTSESIKLEKQGEFFVVHLLKLAPPYYEEYIGLCTKDLFHTTTLSNKNNKEFATRQIMKQCPRLTKEEMLAVLINYDKDSLGNFRTEICISRKSIPEEYIEYTK